MHGHSFRIDVIVAGQVDESKGYLLDFGEIKAVVEPLIAQLDHYCLNDVEGLENPTSEVLAKWLWDRIKPKLPLLEQIDVHETCTSRCEYQGK